MKIIVTLMALLLWFLAWPVMVAHHYGNHMYEKALGIEVGFLLIMSGVMVTTAWWFALVAILAVKL